LAGTHSLFNITIWAVCLFIVYAAIVVVAITNAWTSFGINSSTVGSPLQLQPSFLSSLTVNPGYLPQTNFNMAGHKKHAGMIKTTARHTVSSNNRRHRDVLQAHKQKERKQAGLDQQEQILHGTVHRANITTFYLSHYLQA
jgi:hypothetical protein